jgi:hypothetical protein
MDLEIWSKLYFQGPVFISEIEVSWSWGFEFCSRMFESDLLCFVVTASHSSLTLQYNWRTGKSSDYITGSLTMPCSRGVHECQKLVKV